MIAPEQSIVTRGVEPLQLCWAVCTPLNKSAPAYRVPCSDGKLLPVECHQVSSAHCSARRKQDTDFLLQAAAAKAIARVEVQQERAFECAALNAHNAEENTVLADSIWDCAPLLEQGRTGCCFQAHGDSVCTAILPLWKEPCGKTFGSEWESHSYPAKSWPNFHVATASKALLL